VGQRAAAHRDTRPDPERMHGLDIVCAVLDLYEAGKPEQ